MVNSDNYLYKYCSQEGGGVVHSYDYQYKSCSRGVVHSDDQVLELGVWSIATVSCTVRGVVHMYSYLYKSWGQGCGP